MAPLHLGVEVRLAAADMVLRRARSQAPLPRDTLIALAEKRAGGEGARAIDVQWCYFVFGGAPVDAVETHAADCRGASSGGCRRASDGGCPGTSNGWRRSTSSAFWRGVSSGGWGNWKGRCASAMAAAQSLLALLSVVTAASTLPTRPVRRIVEAGDAELASKRARLGL